MKNILILLLILLAVYLLFMRKDKSDLSVNKTNNVNTVELLPEITPIEHASFVMRWGTTVIYNDPVGGIDKYSTPLGTPIPDLILLSDIHSDHLDIPTLEAASDEGTKIIAPKAVADKLTPDLLAVTTIMENHKQIMMEGFSVETIPMYNLPESPESPHTRGRGNGYVLAKEGIRVYIAGDTADIPEMRALKEIDIAFIPMNLPYTMTVEAAADAVLEFKPRVAIPYHYRGQGGLSDVNKFKELVNAGDPNIEVRLLDWYQAE